MKNALIVSLVLAVCGMAHAGIVNGDFEDGGNDWNTGGGVIVDTDNGPSLLGISCALLDNAADSGGRDWRSNQFDIVSNVEYFLTFDYKTEVGATSNPQVRFRFWKENGDFNGEAQKTLDLTDGTWQTIEISRISAADAVSADIFFSSHKFGDFVGIVKFDNAVVVPEPASLTLLAIGGLAFLRRKK